MAESVRTFYVELLANTAGFNRSMAEAAGSAGALETRAAGFGGAAGGSFRTATGAAEQFHGRVGLIEGGMNRLVGGIAGIGRSMLSVAGQTLGFGALFAGPVLLGVAVKDAEALNRSLAQLKQAVIDSGGALSAWPIDSAEAKLRRLGFTDVDTVNALGMLARAHIAPTEAMAALATAADLARAKDLDLGSAMEVLLKASQGNSRGLMDLGIQGVVAIPKVAALQTATAALALAQKNYDAALAAHGPLSLVTIDAQNKLAAAQAKVALITKEQADRFAGFGTILEQVNAHVAGTALAAAGADPLLVLGAQMRHVAEVGGQQLIPVLDRFVAWIDTHQADVQKFAVTAFHDLGVGIQAVGGFIVHILIPALSTFMGIASSLSGVVQPLSLALGAFYVERKVSGMFSAVKNLVSDLRTGEGLAANLFGKLFGGGAATPSGRGALSALGQSVIVQAFGPEATAVLEGRGVGRIPGEPILPTTGAPAAAVGGVLPAVVGGALYAKVVYDAYQSEQGLADLNTTVQSIGVDLNQVQTITSIWKGDWALLRQNSLNGQFAIRKSLEATGLNSDLATKATNTLQQLYNQHVITTGVQMRRVMGFWQQFVQHSGGIPPTLDQIRFFLQQTAAQAAAMSASAKVYAAALARGASEAQALAAFFASGNYPSRTSGGYIPGGAAVGGEQEVGKPTMVGEHGPEIVTFGRPARVLPNFGSLSLEAAGMGGGGYAGGSGGFTVNIASLNVHGVQDVAALWTQLRRFALNQARQTGIGSLYGRFA